MQRRENEKARKEKRLDGEKRSWVDDMMIRYKDLNFIHEFFSSSKTSLKLHGYIITQHCRQNAKKAVNFF